MRVSRYLRPWLLISAPVLISVIAWLLPGDGLFLRGFSSRSSLSPEAITLGVAFYLVAAFAASIGAAIGGVVPMPRTLERLDGNARFDRGFYAILTVIALVGVVAAYVMVGSQTSILETLRGSQANLLSVALADGSSLATLRYVTIPATALAVYLLLKRRIRIPSVLLNLALLGANALLTSRLALIMSVAMLAFLWFNDDRSRRLRLRVLAVVFLVLFAALTWFNYTRNANFYRALGVENPILMNLYQIAAYVGAPSQVAIGVADAIADKGFGVPVPFDQALALITPSFLSADRSDKSAALDPALYGYHVDIAPNLNANSAFADVFAHYGYWGWLLFFMTLFTSGLVFGMSIRYQSSLAIFAAVIAYCYLEIWRAFLFSQGLILFMMLSLVAALVLAAIFCGRSLGITEGVENRFGSAETTLRVRS